MKLDFFPLIFVFFTCFTGFSQQEITWNTLSDVNFTEEYFPEQDTYFLTPSFGTSLYALENTEVKITGYLLNIDPQSGLYLVSKNPMASCFFCGMAGPETIMEVRFKEKPTFKTDQIISVSGVFKLNGKDIEHCNFILENASGSLKK